MADGATIAAETTVDLFDPADPAFYRDPYPVYARLRDEAPAYRHPASGLWFLTRYHDVERATLDHATFSSSRGNLIIDSPNRVGKTLGSLDPPRHDELRRIVQRGLSPQRIEAILPLVRQATRDRLAALAPAREARLVADLGRPVLFGVLGRMLGLDAAAADVAADLSAGLFHHDDGPLGAVLPPERFGEIFAFLGAQVAQRAVEPGEDLCSVLLAAKRDGAALDDGEIVANLSTVLLAGNASIGHFFPNLMHALWLHPEQRRQVANDAARIPAAIEEAVRWDSSTQAFARQVMRDVDVAGATILAGARVMLVFGSANRDERAIENAGTFDIARRRVRHFGFGLGPHVCAGTNAARAMLRVMLEEILPALGDYELDVAQGQRVEHVMVRGFKDVPIRW